jgi:hypothetical protein
MYVQIQRWIKRARISLQKQRGASFPQKDLAASPVPEEQVDAAKLANFVARRNTYGDICQAFTVEELQICLALAGNDVPTAVLMMRQRVVKTGQVLMPPSYLVDSTSLQVCDPMMLSATRRNSWFEPGWLSSAIRRLSMMSSSESRSGSRMGSKEMPGGRFGSRQASSDSRFGGRQFSGEGYYQRNGMRIGPRQGSTESAGFSDVSNPTTPSAPLAIVRELSAEMEKTRLGMGATK